LGDGGAVVTRDPALADRVARLRNGGQTSRYRHQEAGVNSRLDVIQAAVLRARLPFLARWTATRRALAARYRAGLATANVQLLPERDPGHVYHLFVVRSVGDGRDAFQAHLAERGVETLIHYPVPIPEQPALAAAAPANCAVAARACREILSLPLHHAMTADDVDRVAAAVTAVER